MYEMYNMCDIVDCKATVCVVHQCPTGWKCPVIHVIKWGQLVPVRWCIVSPLSHGIWDTGGPHLVSQRKWFYNYEIGRRDEG